MGLIAGSDKITSAPPNLAPEWTQTPTVVFNKGVASSVDLSSYTFDADGDSLSFTLSSASPLLPEGVSISGTSLVATVSTSAAVTSAVLVEVSDGVNASVTSPPFNITVQSVAWLGDGLTGEFGCLATNDNHGTTVYEYQRQHAPTLPTIPTPTTGAALPTSNAVNPNASDEYLMFTWNASAVNASAYRVVFFAKGMDASGATWPTITTGGSASSPRWFVYYDPDTPSNVNDIKPWNLAVGDRAQVPRMTQSGVDYLYIVGLDFGSNGFGRQKGCTNITYWRCMAENFTIHCVGPATTRSDNITVFECLAHTSVAASASAPQVDIGFWSAVVANSGCRFISNECYDIHGDMVGCDSAARTDDFIVEDNDFYRTRFSNGSGLESTDSNQDYSRGEGFVDMKLVGTDATSTKCLVQGNRVWGMRKVDPVLHTGSGTGAPMAFSISSNQKWKVDVRYNVFDDSTSQGITYIDGANLGGGYHSIVGNLISNVRDSTVCWVPTNNTEVYLNTIVDVASASATFDWTRQTAPTTVESFDAIGNCIINSRSSGSFVNTARLDSNSQFIYTAFIGTGETYEKGGTGTNYVNTSAPAMAFGDFTYRRKKLTGPETATITGVVPTTSTPSAFRTGAPGAGDADQIGGRAGIGVDDSILSTW